MTSSSVQPAKTKSLESTKRKRKSSEHVSDVELEAASSIVQMSRKKSKKAVKKVVAAEVRRVPSIFDDDIFAEPSQKGFSSWPFLRFNFHEQRTPGSENEFMDVGSFSDVVPEVRKEIDMAAAANDVIEVAKARPSTEASSEFARELEMTIHKVEDPVQDVPLIENREDLPEGQDPSPSVVAFKKSFGTSYHGELLSVGSKVADVGGGASKILTLWKSPTLIDETGEGVSEHSTQLLEQNVRDSGKDPRTSSKETPVSQDKSSRKKVTAKDLSKKRFVSPACPFRIKLHDFPLMALFRGFSEFEDLLRSYPASKFANYHRDYAAKASIAGRIACKRLTEQEKATEEPSKESRKLKRNFNLAQAANLDLEKKVAELVEALKRCQDDKKNC
jgi:hypothetical protein